MHCTAGKDRTGVICALVLSLCGVPDAVVAHEYALTDLGLAPRREEFIAQLLKTEPIRGNRAAAERMISARQVAPLAVSPPGRLSPWPSLPLAVSPPGRLSSCAATHLLLLAVLPPRAS